MEIFLKRAENPFKERIGEERTRTLFDNLKNSLYLIPGEFSGSLGPEITKFLFTYSQGLEKIPAENIESILNHFLLFTNSLKDLANQNLKQVNQTLIIRSKSEIRNLSDLLQSFVAKAENSEIMKDSERFEDIISFTIGESVKIAKFEEFELFVKRSGDNFAQKIGDNKAAEFSEEINKALKNLLLNNFSL